MCIKYTPGLFLEKKFSITTFISQYVKELNQWIIDN